MWQRKSDSKPSSKVPEKPVASVVETPKIETPKVETEVPTISAASSDIAPTPAAVAASETVTVPAPVTQTSAAQASAVPASSNSNVFSSPTPSTPRGEISVSRISAGLKIRGEITGTSDITIDGQVEGKVRVEAGTLTVGPAGRVKADVEAREIVVNGVLDGNLKATDRVQLGSTGSVKGSVLSPRIGIEDGGHLSGKVETSTAWNAGGVAESQRTAKAAAASAGTSKLAPVGVDKEGE